MAYRRKPDKKKRKFGNTVYYECDRCHSAHEEEKPEKCFCGHKEFTFHQSKKEFMRWKELLMMQKGNAVSQVKRQVPIRLDVKGVHICNYIADFCYLEDGKRIVEDVKSDGTITNIYKLKKKLVGAIHGIEIREYN